MTGEEEAGREGGRHGARPWSGDAVPAAQSPSGVPPLDIPRLSTGTLQPGVVVAPQPLRAGGGLQIGEALQRATSPLQRAHSPGVRSNTSYTYLDSESRMEAAGLLMEELSTLKAQLRMARATLLSGHSENENRLSRWTSSPHDSTTATTRLAHSPNATSFVPSGDVSGLQTPGASHGGEQDILEEAIEEQLQHTAKRMEVLENELAQGSRALDVANVKLAEHLLLCSTLSAKLLWPEDNDSFQDAVADNALGEDTACTVDPFADDHGARKSKALPEILPDDPIESLSPSESGGDSEPILPHIISSRRDIEAAFRNSELQSQSQVETCTSTSSAKNQKRLAEQQQMSEYLANLAQNLKSPRSSSHTAAANGTPKASWCGGEQMMTPRSRVDGIERIILTRDLAKALLCWIHYVSSARAERLRNRPEPETSEMDESMGTEKMTNSLLQSPVSIKAQRVRDLRLPGIYGRMTDYIFEQRKKHVKARIVTSWHMLAMEGAWRCSIMSKRKHERAIELQRTVLEQWNAKSKWCVSVRRAHAKIEIRAERNYIRGLIQRWAGHTGFRAARFRLIRAMRKRMVVRKCSTYFIAWAAATSCQQLSVQECDWDCGFTGTPGEVTEHEKTCEAMLLATAWRKNTTLSLRPRADDMPLEADRARLLQWIPADSVAALGNKDLNAWCATGVLRRWLPKDTARSCARDDEARSESGQSCMSQQSIQVESSRSKRVLAKLCSLVRHEDEDLGMLIANSISSDSAEEAAEQVAAALVRTTASAMSRCLVGSSEAVVLGFLELLEEFSNQTLPMSQILQPEEVMCGVGMRLTESNPPRVIEMLPRSPAGMCGGIKVGDILTTIDGHDVTSKNIALVRSMIAGPEGTTVSFEFVRELQNGSEKHSSVKLTRAVLDFSIEASLLESEDIDSQVKILDEGSPSTTKKENLVKNTPGVPSDQENSSLGPDFEPQLMPNRIQHVQPQLPSVVTWRPTFVATAKVGVSTTSFSKAEELLSLDFENSLELQFRQLDKSIQGHKETEMELDRWQKVNVQLLDQQAMPLDGESRGDVQDSADAGPDAADSNTSLSKAEELLREARLNFENRLQLQSQEHARELDKLIQGHKETEMELERSRNVIVQLLDQQAMPIDWESRGDVQDSADAELTTQLSTVDDSFQDLDKTREFWEAQSTVRPVDKHHTERESPVETREELESRVSAIVKIMASAALAASFAHREFQREGVLTAHCTETIVESGEDSQPAENSHSAPRIDPDEIVADKSIIAELEKKLKDCESEIGRLRSDRKDSIQPLSPAMSLSQDPNARQAQQLPPGWKAYWSKSKQKPFYKKKGAPTTFWQIPEEELAVDQLDGSFPVSQNKAHTFEDVVDVQSPREGQIMSAMSYGCEGACGFTGSFDEVAAHEKTCKLISVQVDVNAHGASASAGDSTAQLPREGQTISAMSYGCEGACGFTGSFDEVAAHEKTCKLISVQVDASARERTAQESWCCESGCGFKGAFDEVTQHERTCTFKKGKPTSASQMEQMLTDQVKMLTMKLELMEQEQIDAPGLTDQVKELTTQVDLLKKEQVVLKAELDVSNALLNCKEKECETLNECLKACDLDAMKGMSKENAVLMQQLEAAGEQAMILEYEKEELTTRDMTLTADLEAVALQAERLESEVRLAAEELVQLKQAHTDEASAAALQAERLESEVRLAVEELVQLKQVYTNEALTFCGLPLPSQAVHDNIMNEMPVAVSLRLDSDFDQTTRDLGSRARFNELLTEDVGIALGVPKSSVKVLCLQRGSVIAEVVLMAAAERTGDAPNYNGRTPQLLAEELQGLVRSQDGKLSALPMGQLIRQAEIHGPIAESVFKTVVQALQSAVEATCEEAFLIKPFGSNLPKDEGLTANASTQPQSPGDSRTQGAATVEMGTDALRSPRSPRGTQTFPEECIERGTQAASPTHVMSTQVWIDSVGAGSQATAEVVDVGTDAQPKSPQTPRATQTASSTTTAVGIGTEERPATPRQTQTENPSIVAASMQAMPDAVSVEAQARPDVALAEVQTRPEECGTAVQASPKTGCGVVQATVEVSEQAVSTEETVSDLAQLAAREMVRDVNEKWTSQLTRTKGRNGIKRALAVWRLEAEQTRALERRLSWKMSYFGKYLTRPAFQKWCYEMITTYVIRQKVESADQKRELLLTREVLAMWNHSSRSNMLRQHKSEMVATRVRMRSLSVMFAQWCHLAYWGASLHGAKATRARGQLAKCWHMWSRTVRKKKGKLAQLAHRDVARRRLVRAKYLHLWEYQAARIRRRNKCRLACETMHRQVQLSAVFEHWNIYTTRNTRIRLEEGQTKPKLLVHVCPPKRRILAHAIDIWTFGVTHRFRKACKTSKAERRFVALSKKRSFGGWKCVFANLRHARRKAIAMMERSRFYILEATFERFVVNRIRSQIFQRRLDTHETFTLGAALDRWLPAIHRALPEHEGALSDVQNPDQVEVAKTVALTEQVTNPASDDSENRERANGRGFTNGSATHHRNKLTPVPAAAYPVNAVMSSPAGFLQSGRSRTHNRSFSSDDEAHERDAEHSFLEGKASAMVTSRAASPSSSDSSSDDDNTRSHSSPGDGRPRDRPRGSPSPSERSWGQSWKIKGLNDLCASNATPSSRPRVSFSPEISAGSPQRSLMSSPSTRETHTSAGCDDSLQTLSSVSRLGGETARELRSRPMPAVRSRTKVDPMYGEACTSSRHQLDSNHASGQDRNPPRESPGDDRASATGTQKTPDRSISPQALNLRSLRKSLRTYD